MRQEGGAVKVHRSKRKRRLWITLGLVAIVLLAAVVFTLGSLRIPLHPEEGNGLVIWFALNTVIAAGLLIFTLIMTRSLLRLWNERRVRQIGSRFKAKMVLGAMGVSLLPVVFLFFFSYALLNRTLNLWFPRPLEVANQESQSLLDEFVTTGYARRTQQAQTACEIATKNGATPASVAKDAAPEADEVWFFGGNAQTKA